MVIKQAEKHLDLCEIDDCKFCSGSICCFGAREKGCIYHDQIMQHEMKLMAEFEIQHTISAYECSPFTAEERVHIDDYYEVGNFTYLKEGLIKDITRITGKEFNFIYKGHEYTYRDNSMDFKSCPHCGHDKSTFIGSYGQKETQISCFECSKCFKKFYYHGCKNDK